MGCLPGSRSGDSCIVLASTWFLAKPWDRSRRGCRRCSSTEETLPHVLNHCMRYSAAYQSRHNAVMDRVHKAAGSRWNLLSANQVFPGTNLRPDLVLCKDRSAIVIDVTISFENRLSAFSSAREDKITKYRPVVDLLKRDFADVRSYAFVVGSLGAWDKENDKLLRRLCSNKYANLLRKLVVSETIRYSRNIYVEHLTGIRQM
ncbi:uncharacterized protein LOC118180617 [Stegodyphus dumicola]|uniref:uncharacterized protein LOC118180617 n=1 Tax=Stegodyphus dumicola TaxID=202533 RepID=UPI0015B0C769|nr:uncharacterized protein LOC118180617 [Stegodyphus dumicola]